ncbi:hypothetical protein [Actinomadura hibisca]|uniref:hypothetical protein n=1 Tax=Actinomadura hibisca TaxID=68565 RepID=UPI0008341D54|nr:hypothetical protein [Actinomadura hibisca]
MTGAPPPETPAPDASVPLHSALEIAKAAYEEAMRTYGLLPGTITAINALAATCIADLRDS